MNTTAIREGNYIQTFTGHRFYPLDPRPEEISIDDIAHALSNLCRFTGHVRSFYSVAQHSVLVSHQVLEEHALAALLHDASEAYLADLSRPVKSLPGMRHYSSIEHGVMSVIAFKFGFDYPFHESIKEADERMLFTEKRDLMYPLDWGYEIEPYDARIIPLAPVNAKTLFFKRLHELQPIYSYEIQTYFIQTRHGKGD